MGYNIHWAKPTVKECWSYGGRLYMSKKKAQIEQAKDQKWYQECLEKHGPDHWRVKAGVGDIHKITWLWEVDN